MTALIEVPVMLCLVWTAMRLRPRRFGGGSPEAPPKALEAAHAH